MSMPNSELEAWLAGSDIFDETNLESDDWVAGFDADRQLVLLKIGPYKRMYLRPNKFTKRFYHQLYPLNIETWPYRRQIKLFDDFCQLDISVDVRFQATLEYAQRNAEAIATINQHIKQLYAEVLEDQVNQTLHTLADGVWIHNGLLGQEKRIALSICETLTQQYIQAQAVCHMVVTFAEFPDVQLGKDSVYVNVLKKTFELSQQKAIEIYRQQRIAEQQELLEQQQQLEHLKQLAEMQRQIHAQEAKAQLQLLQDKELQIAEQRSVERRIHTEQVNHEQQLKDISFDIETKAQQLLKAKHRLVEAQQLTDQLAHQAFIDDKKTQAEIQRRESAQRRWQEAAQGGLENIKNRVAE
jgi:hypothetical protein